MADKISVIIPVYNGEKTISKCIESLLNQAKKPEEIIVVDDGSTDKTRDMVRKFRGVVLLEQEHKGPAAARNLGAKKAQGDILLFTDADCSADENWILEMAKPFEKKEITGVQGRYKTHQKGVMARFVQLEIEDRYDRMRKRRFIDFIGSYSAGYRKREFMQFGGFDESFPTASGEDPELSFKLAKTGHKMVFNDNAVVYHNHVDSLSAYLRQKFWRAYWRVLLYRKHPAKMAGESYTPQILKFQIITLCLLVLSLAVSPLTAYYAYFATLFAILLLLSTFPLAFKNAKKDVVAGIWTPLISLLRTVVFTLGLILGTVRL